MRQFHIEMEAYGDKVAFYDDQHLVMRSPVKDDEIEEFMEQWRAAIINFMEGWNESHNSGSAARLEHQPLQPEPQTSG